MDLRPLPGAAFCVILLLARVCFAVGPATPVEEPPHVEVQDIIISATRTSEPAHLVPASATVLTETDIQATPYRQGFQVDDLLRYVPGVQPSNLSSLFNHPTAQAISLRGLGSRRTLVLLDGVPLNDGFGGWINWGLIPDSVDRIEIIPSGSSNLYGNWAMGGVIHVLTKPPLAHPGLTLEGRGGTLDTYTTGLHGRYRTERLGASFGYRWFHTNGFITVPEDQRGPIDNRDDARHQLLTGSLAWALSPRVEASLSGNFFREDRSFGTPLSLATRTIGTVVLGLTGATTRGDRYKGKVFGQWQTFRNKTSLVLPPRLTEARDRIQTVPSNDFGGQFQWESTLHPAHRAVLGVDARGILGQSEEELFPASGSTGRTLAEGVQIGWGAYAEWIARPTERAALVPSVRFDWWKNFDGRIEDESGAVTRPPDNTETALNPKLVLRYWLSQTVSLGGSVFRAFRAPTLNELYRGFGFAGFSFLPNPGLQPERLWGGETNLAFADVLEGRLRLRLTGYLEEVTDQIIFISDGAASATRENVGRTRSLGAELDGKFTLHRLVSLHLGYAYTDATIREFAPDPTREGNRVPNVSAHQVSLRVTLGDPRTLQLTLLGRYLSRQFADDLNRQAIADFIVLDASARRDLGEHVRLFLDAENLTDLDYVATQTGSIKTLGAPLLVIGGVRLEY